MIKLNEDDRPDFLDLRKKYIPKAVIDCSRSKISHENDISKNYPT